MRESGILLPIFSLPSRYGIGCFSRDAYDFLDFLERSGTGYWQILPMGPTGFGNSPYQPVSAFAGNPYFISPETLIEDGLLTYEEADSFSFGSNPDRVDYGALYENREKLLAIASARFYEKLDTDPELSESFSDFKHRESFWLTDYADFVAIKKHNGGASWQEWDEDLKKRDALALSRIKSEQDVKECINLIYFEQYEFDRQWRALREYAAKKNIKIIGDLPFYVSLDSSDVWSHPEVFLMDANLKPTVVAGCPPDAFSATGQLWGNPIYDWKALSTVHYKWWTDRMQRNYELFDVIRIDHFHGFCDYYAIPFEDETAEHGKSEKGPGIALFKELKEQLGELRIIAEDLGNQTPENVALLEESGFPGMKVLQYGFTSWDSCYVNHRHTANSVVYTGTHDNTPTRAWVEEISEGERSFTRRYINSLNTDYNGLVWDIIREAYRSVADLCIIPIQDYLCLGREARINTPGSGEGNWQWRLWKGAFSNELASSIRGMTEVYSRIPKTPEVPEETQEVIETS